MKFAKIEYTALNAKQKEIFNFQKIAGLLADYGYNCIKLADDWQGADFLAYHKDGKETLRVQLKSRLTIDKCYIGKNLRIAFPLHQAWYLVEHDRLVDVVGSTTRWLHTESWLVNGRYHSASPSQPLIAALRDDALGVI
ncbi:MAG: hypothetical protein ACSLE5_02290 [Porticoccaceae bacterium]